MSELVDKKDVLKIVDNVQSDLSYWAVTDGIIVTKPDTFDRLHKEIERIKPADVVEVVRCKDCKRWNSDYDYCEEYATEKWAGDFCSSGARKDLED